jgi:hypothetical protein
MFSSNGRNPFASRGLGCVKLPATAAFPTDDKLLQRIEQARRALPRDSIKALRRVPQVDQAVLVSDLLTASVVSDEQSRAEVARAAVQRFRVVGTELGSPLLEIEELYPRGKAAAG